MEKLITTTINSEQDVLALESEPILTLNIDDLTNQQSETNPKLFRVLERVKEQKEGVSAHSKHSSHHSHGQHSSAMW